MNRSILACAMLSIGVWLTACAPFLVESKVVDDTGLFQAKQFYVMHNPDDTGSLDKVIEGQLVEMGFSASTGVKKNMPSDTDILVTYEFHWFWDLSNYLLMFEIELRNPETYFPLAKGNSWRASLARRTPEEMAREILEPILFPAKGGDSAAAKKQ